MKIPITRTVARRLTNRVTDTKTGFKDTELFVMSVCPPIRAIQGQTYLCCPIMPQGLRWGHASGAHRRGPRRRGCLLIFFKRIAPCTIRAVIFTRLEKGKRMREYSDTSLSVVLDTYAVSSGTDRTT